MTNGKYSIPLAVLFLIFAWTGCQEDNPISGCEDCKENGLIEGTYDPRPYELEVPEWLPRPIIPNDNPLTEAGVTLGRFLFYDPVLSADGSMSCASCHRQELAFTDGKALSTGVLGLEGTRSSMSLVNLAFHPNGFFWDGRAQSLEEQALVPIEDHREFNEDWGNVVEKLQNHDRYPEMFRSAFGIDRKSEITKELTVKAIAQFERTLISGYSRFDRVVWMNEGWFTDSEQRGKQLFFLEPVDDHPGCSHCHFDPLFTDNSFKNNGLDSVATLSEFADPGFGAVTGNVYDNGKFKVPTLRNIALTAPYMHDGRFATLEEVLDHYSSGGHGVVNEDVNILPFPLTEQQKADMIAFLKTLTDEDFINNPAFSSPFK